MDVVPAGEGWTGDPYVLEKRGGRLYGRGTADDKGAAVVALYCLKALKDERVKCVRKARAIFGAGEEIASDDLKQYFQRELCRSLPLRRTPNTAYATGKREFYTWSFPPRRTAHGWKASMGERSATR